MRQSASSLFTTQIGVDNMAALAKRPVPTAAPRRRSSAGLAKLERMKLSAARARSRASRLAREKQGVIIAGVGAAAIGFAEKKGYRLPTLGGIEPTLLYGLMIAFVGPMVVKGNAGEALSDIGEGLLAVAAYKFGTGQPVLSGDDIDDGSPDSMSGDQWSPA